MGEHSGFVSSFCKIRNIEKKSCFEKEKKNEPEQNSKKPESGKPKLKF